MPIRSSSSAGAVYLDKPQRIEQLRAAAGRARDAMPSIERVVLFGSMVAGIPTPRSDADLLVIVSDSAEARPADRIPSLLSALSPLPCPVDLFVLTREEFHRASDDGDALVREALTHGIDLL